MADAEKSMSLSVLGKDASLEGEIKSSGNLMLVGKVSGKVVSKGDVLVQDSSVCEVDEFCADSVMIFGKVRGDICASGGVDMKSGSRVCGNVSAAQIRIEDDVDFEGRVSMTDDKTEADIFSHSSDDLKGILSKTAGGESKKA